ncbi:hypothetical protein [Bacteroides phage LoVEphage]|nr:hypothetical protein [Bacteroides phage LoVEphage]UBU95355.1 MAG: hypothetical protein [Bacteroides phage LoVEphage]UYE98377.1 MAG: hypothetical protein [Bacteroides phage R001]DAN67689.1 MAG TPA: LIM domain protein [Caudoviricetes sp.]DAW57396.1 MAG TPA: LIM domain protein [Caudoviricetes sp.]
MICIFIRTNFYHTPCFRCKYMYWISFLKTFLILFSIKM